MVNELTSEIILAILNSGDKLKDKNAIYGFELSNAFLGMLTDVMISDKLLFVPGDAHVGMYVNYDRQGVIDFHKLLGAGGCQIVLGATSVVKAFMFVYTGIRVV
ncbi:MAG: hypothetical protein GX288_01960 [Clostridiales bacterium]|nr:hypothetical protein [Clostridiales bacterium]